MPIYVLHSLHSESSRETLLSKSGEPNGQSHGDWENADAIWGITFPEIENHHPTKNQHAPGTYFVLGEFLLSIYGVCLAHFWGSGTSLASLDGVYLKKVAVTTGVLIALIQRMPTDNASYSACTFEVGVRLLGCWDFGSSGLQEYEKQKKERMWQIGRQVLI